MRVVTEEDFRLPEYRGEKPEDYEFNAENKPVRKDRWYTAIQHIRCLVGVDGRSYDISQVIEAVKTLAADERWVEYCEHDPAEDMLGQYIDIKLNDGSILVKARVVSNGFDWRNTHFAANVGWWRDYPKGDE